MERGAQKVTGSIVYTAAIQAMRAPAATVYPVYIQTLYCTVLCSVVLPQIRVVDLMDHVLSTYDRQISIYTAEQFKRAGAPGWRDRLGVYIN